MPKGWRGRSYGPRARQMMERGNGFPPPGPFLLAGAAIGAALVYFFDPDSGRRRRAMTRDRTMAFFRRQLRYAGRFGRGVGAEAYGLKQKTIHEVPGFFRSDEAADDTVSASTTHEDIGGPGQIPPVGDPIVTGAD